MLPIKIGISTPRWRLVRCASGEAAEYRFFCFRYDKDEKPDQYHSAPFFQAQVRRVKDGLQWSGMHVGQLKQRAGGDDDPHIGIAEQSLA